jgi:hypothetical protein
MWQGTFVLEHLAKITAIDPAIAGRAQDQVFGLVLRRIAEEFTDVFAARDHRVQSSSVSRLTAGASGFLNFNQS